MGKRSHCASSGLTTRPEGGDIIEGVGGRDIMRERSMR